MNMLQLILRNINTIDTDLTEEIILLFPITKVRVK